MHETNPIAKVTGEVKIGGQDIYSETSAWKCGGASGWCSSGRTRFDDVDLRQCRVGPELNGFRNRRFWMKRWSDR